MTKFLASFVALLTGATAALAAYPLPPEVQYQLNRGTETMRRVQLGTQLVEKKKQVMKAQYNFTSVGGGASSIINLLDTDGKSAVLPSKAIVTNVLFDVLTAPATAGTSSFLVFSTGQTAGDIKPSTTLTSFSGLVTAIPANTVATAIKLTAQRNPTMTIGSSALTAGKINVFIEYLLSD